MPLALPVTCPIASRYLQLTFQLHEHTHTCCRSPFQSPQNPQLLPVASPGASSYLQLPVQLQQISAVTHSYCQVPLQLPAITSWRLSSYLKIPTVTASSHISYLQAPPVIFPVFCNCLHTAACPGACKIITQLLPGISPGA